MNIESNGFTLTPPKEAGLEIVSGRKYILNSPINNVNRHPVMVIDRILSQREKTGPRAIVKVLFGRARGWVTAINEADLQDPRDGEKDFLRLA